MPSLVQGASALHIAAIAGHSRVVRTLLAAGASPWLPGVAGMLPLHMAAAKSHLAAVRLLLQAAPTAAAALDEHGRCPLHFAADKGATAVVRALLAAAPQAARIKTHHDAESPLFMAVRQGQDAVVSLTAKWRCS